MSTTEAPKCRSCGEVAVKVVRVESKFNPEMVTIHYACDPCVPELTHRFGGRSDRQIIVKSI
jgi:hypothetical protein